MARPANRHTDNERQPSKRQAKYTTGDVTTEVKNVHNAEDRQLIAINTEIR